MLFTFCVLNLYAQKFVASPSQQEVSLGDAFQIEWTAEGLAGNVTLPDIKDFDILMGPSQENSFSNANGVMTQSTIFMYHLRARKVGTFKIPAAIVRTRNGIVKSNEITIKVVQGNISKNGAKGKNDGAEGNGGAEFFISATVDKANVYEGEPITVTYKLYLYKVDPQGVAYKKYPNFTGFWAKDLPDQVEKQLHAETKNGKQYLVAVVKKSTLYPQHTGDLIIDPLEMDAALAMQVPRQKRNNVFDPFGDDFFDRFFNQNVEVVRKLLRSNTVTVHVNDVPSNGKPTSYSGLVGNFHIHAAVDKTKLKENEALTYKVTVEGNGNLQQLQAFSLNLPPDWDVYDPKTSDKPGAKTFEYTIIPKKMGKYTIPALEFSYFDIGSKKFNTEQTKVFEINVEKGNGILAAPGSGLNKEDIKLLGTDIRFIKTSTSELEKNSTPFYGSWKAYLLGLLPFPIFALLILLRRRNEEQSLDIKGSLRKKATGIAKRSLKNAKTNLDKNDKLGFYTEVLFALYGYVQNKIGLQLSETSRDTIKEVLQNHQASAETITQLIAILDACEYAKYAPSAVSSNLKEVYQQSVELISAMEEQLK